MTEPSVESGEGFGQTSVSLLVRVKARDAAAWHRFVNIYSPLVFAWCCRAGLQEADAADVGQEVFRTVAGSIGGYEHRRNGGSFRGWLWSVTRTRILDFRRKQKRTVSAVGGTDAHETLDHLSDEGLEERDPSSEDDKQQLILRAIDVILDNCKDVTRQAFIRVVVDGHQPAEVARELGLSVNAVYVAKSHLLHRIRSELAELVEF